MIIISEQEFLDNQSSIEDLCATHNAKVIPGDNGGQPAMVIFCQTDDEEDQFWKSYTKLWQI